MKISLYSLHLGKGGVETYVMALANILATQHDVNLIVTYKVKDEANFSFNENIHVKYLIDGEPNIQLFKQSLRELKLFKSVSLLFKNGRILVQKYLLNIKAIRKDTSEVVISTRIFHNSLIGRYGQKKSIKITTEHNHHNNNNKYISKLKKSITHFNYLIPISDELTQFYQHEFRNLNIIVFNIPFYVETQNKLSNTMDPNYVYIGRLSQEKAVEDVIRCFKIIYDNNPSSRLTVVGDGEEMVNLIKLTDFLELGDKVTFTGYLERSEINSLLETQMILLLTSHTESFGIVLLEAMSFGVIPIIFDSAQGGLEILKGFETLVIPNRSKQKMASVANNLVNDSQQRKKIQLEIIKRSKLYDFKSMKSRWLDFLQAL